MVSPDIELSSKTIIPPVMGWNTKDALSAMGPEYAVEAENFFSNGSSVDYRKGYRYYAKNVGTGIGTAVIALWEFALQNGTRKMISLTSDNRVTSVDAGGTQDDLSNAGAIVMGLDATAVTYRNLIFIKDSGATACRTWDGASANLTAPAFVGPGGADVLLTNPMPYKSRLYFCGMDLSIWYTDVNAIAGTLTQFDFQSQFTKGGRLLFCGPASQIGVNNDQFFVAISDQGEVLLYAGDYPGSTATWALVGHYYMPPPVGRRSFFFWGQNLVIITFQGIVLLSDVMRAEGDLVFLSDKINDQFIETIATTSFGTEYISGIFYPQGNMLIFNIPSGTSVVQFVMNTITRSWWKWTGLGGAVGAFAFSLLNNNLYFGTGTASVAGKVMKMWTGYFDENNETEGAAVARTIKLRCAYNYFGDTESFKQFTFCIPTIYQTNTFSATLDSNVDYANTVATSANTRTDKGNDYQIYQERCGLQGIGKAASIRFDGTVTDKRSSLQAIEVFFTNADVA